MTFIFIFKPPTSVVPNRRLRPSLGSQVGLKLGCQKILNIINFCSILIFLSLFFMGRRSRSVTDLGSRSRKFGNHLQHKSVVFSHDSWHILLSGK